MADFAAEVRRLMTERGMSLRALAKAASYDPSYLSKVLSVIPVPGRVPGRRPRRGRRDPGRRSAASAAPGAQGQRTGAETIGRGRGAPGRDGR
jgi:helix-turn-helix protein